MTWRILYLAFYAATIPFLLVAIPVAVLSDWLGDVEVWLRDLAREETMRS